MSRNRISRLALVVGAVTMLSADFASAENDKKRRERQEAKQAQRAEQAERQAQRQAERQQHRSEAGAQQDAERAARQQHRAEAAARQEAERAARQQSRAAAMESRQAEQAQRQALREQHAQQNANRNQRRAERAAEIERARAEQQQHIQSREAQRAEQIRQQQILDQKRGGGSYGGYDNGGYNNKERMIAMQKQKLDAYNASLGRDVQRAKQRQARLREARREQQYRYEQEYLRRLEAQRYAMRSYNYANDPYYTTAPSYRYSRGGQYYQVNQYAADLLRQAVNNGYAEGLRSGQADRGDGYRFDYRDSFAYQNADYGYDRMYVDESEYNHYFREGFERGYQDGYYSRSQFGTSSGGRFNILATVLNAILAFQSLR